MKHESSALARRSTSSFESARRSWMSIRDGEMTIGSFERFLGLCVSGVPSAKPEVAHDLVFGCG